MGHCIVLFLQKILCNLMRIRKMIRFVLLIAYIGKIDLHVIGIKEQFIYPRVNFMYFVQFYFFFHLSKRHFNISRVVWYINKLVVSLLIIFNKILIIWQNSLVFIISSIKSNQVTRKIYENWINFSINK